MMKFSLPLSVALIASMAVSVLGADDVCHDAWAYDTTLNQCSATLGYDPWGWTNGRYGMSGCEDCDCPDCPTEAPTPDQPPTPATPAPTPPPVPLPQTCVGFGGSSSGDPHIRTLDKLTYDCQGEGEFHLLKSTTSTFEMQARFTRFTTESRPTKTSAVVWNTGDGEPKMQVNAPDTPDAEGTCIPDIFVEDAYKDVVVEGTGNPNVQFASWFRPRTTMYVFYYHNSGFQVTITSKVTSDFGCVLAVKVCLPYDWERTSEELVGLLGSPDNDQSNDWMNRNNVPVDIPADRRERLGVKAYDYCVDNWCIRKVEDSLFHYQSGESYNGYNHCGLSNDIETQECIDDPPKEVEDVCGPDNYECIVDGCAGGEAESRNWLLTESEGVEGECGREIFFENFDSPYASSWGEIAQGDLDSQFLRLHKNTPKFIKQFTVPKSADMVRVEFLFYEIGYWESGTTNRDWVHFFVWDTPVDLLTFDSRVTAGNVMETYEGYTRGLSWHRMAVTNATDMGFGSHQDQMHRVTVNIPNSYFADGQLRIGFLVSMSHGKVDESAGIDDFRINALGIECDLEFDEKQPTNVNIDPVELPLVCDERVAVIWGDPHIQTFDGYEYDCQAGGEFVLAKSTDGKTEIQGRFGKPVAGRQATVLKSLAVKEVNASSVEVGLGDYSNGKCELDLLVNGKQIDPDHGYIFEHVVVSELNNKAVVMYYPFTRLQVIATYHYSRRFGCFLSAKICVPEEFRYGQALKGLLGSNDGDPNNEWMTPTGNTVTSPTGVTRFLNTAYNYCTGNWCITDRDDSIFKHDDDASFNSVNKCGESYSAGQQESCVRNPTSDLEELCGDNMACRIDACAGDTEDGENAIREKDEITDERGCGFTMIKTDFQEMTQNWGLCGEDPTSGQGYRLFYRQFNQFAFTLGEIPPVADRVQIEFLLYSTSDYKNICPYGNNMRFCRENKLLLAFGTTQAQSFFELDMFAVGEVKLRGYKRGIRWHRQALDDYTHRVELQIPKKYFQGDLFAFDVRTIFGHPSFSLGLDDFRLTVYSDKCKPLHDFLYSKYGPEAFGGTARRGLRITSTDPEPPTSTGVVKHPVSRRLDKDEVVDLVENEDHPAVSRDLRGMFGATVQVTTCQCLCPALSDGSTVSSSVTSVTMNLYVDYSDETCDPQGGSIGTVTLTANYNGTATITYEVDEGYYITDISIYTGEEELPGRDSGNILPAIQFPIVDSPSAGTTTVAYNSGEIFVCDFYLAAYARVCGNFPPTPGPTEAPTRQTSAPTAYPTRAPIPETESPTFGPTSSPTGSPTPKITEAPTGGPTASPTESTEPPVADPTASPTASPTAPPTFRERNAPTPPAPTKPEPQPTPAEPNPTPEAPKPTPAAAPTPGSYGDPHIMTWNGTEYDFHGACDLVLLHNPTFANGLGMELHIRTKIDTWWSYIETAALRIGKDTFEVMGGDGLKYWFNGNPGRTNLKNGRALGRKLAGEYKIKFRWLNNRQHQFKVDLGSNGESVTFKTFKQFVRVTVESSTYGDFHESSGLMGSYPGGLRLARDNVTILEDVNDLGKEWQVHSSEPKLFHAADGPQHPEGCVMPTETETSDSRQRRLGESAITREDAERACARVDEDNRKSCVFDILATNDLDMAETY